MDAYRHMCERSLYVERRRADYMKNWVRNLTDVGFRLSSFGSGAVTAAATLMFECEIAGENASYIGNQILMTD